MFYEFNRAPNFNDVEPFLKIDLNRSCLFQTYATDRIEQYFGEKSRIIAEADHDIANGKRHHED